MKKIDACKLRRKGGFTLVELIVVLVLLSILSAVAVPTYLGFVDDNKAKQCETHRKALASRLEEMSAMGSDVELTDAMINGDENGCPAGGTYTLTGTADESDINSKTITCSIEEHGSTTVMLRNNSQVTAKSNTETEKKVETEPEQTDPPVKPIPVLSISITPNPVTMEKEQTQNLTANVVSKEYCEISSYEWRSDRDSIVSVSGSGQTVTITAVNEGTCTIFCKAKATASAEAGGQSVESTEVGVQVMVNAKPSLSISVTPDSISDVEVGSKITLTASKNEKNCSVNNWNWNTGDWNNIEITDGGESSIEIMVKQAGSYNITCQATATPNGGGDNILSNMVTIPVQVKGKETETNATTVNMLLVGEQSKTIQDYYIYPPNYGMPDGGVWSWTDSRITGSGNYICFSDQRGEFNSSTGDTFELTYTVGQTQYDVSVRIIYICYTFIKHMRSDDTINMKVGETLEFGIQYGPHYTTDVIVWSNSKDSVVSMTSQSNQFVPGKVDAYCTWKFKAETTGTTQITATVSHEIDLSDRPKIETQTWTINVTEPGQLASLSADNMRIDKDESKDINYHYNSDATLNGVEFRYTYDDTIISIDNNTGKVTGKKYGNTRVKAEAYKNGTFLASCEFDVRVSRFNSIGIDPNSFNLAPGETAFAQMSFDPWDAKTDDVELQFIGYDTGICKITQDPGNKKKITVEGIAPGQQQTVTVRAMVDGKTLAETSFTVNVKRIKSINVDPNLVIFTPNEEKTIKLVVDPPDADLSNLTFELSRWENLPELKSVDIQNKTITLLAHDQVGGVWWQTLKVKEDGNELASCSVQTKVEAAAPLEDFWIEDVSVQEGSTAKAVMHLTPENADLTGVKFNYQCMNAKAVSITAEGVVTGLKAGESTLVTASASKDGETFVSGKEFTVTVTERSDPTRLTAIQIDPVYVQKDSTATVVMHLTPENPDLTGVTFNYGIIAPDMASISADGTVTGIKEGNTKGWVYATKTDGGNVEKLVEDTYFNVYITGKTTPPTTPTKFSIDGKEEYSLTSWETMKDYIKKKKAGEEVSELPDPVFLIAYYGEENWTVYALKKEHTLQWEDSYGDTMTFSDYYNSNRGDFCWVASYNIYPTIQSFPDSFDENGEYYYWGCNEGTIIERKGKRYIALENIPQEPLINWTEEDFERKFAEMTSVEAN